MSADRANPFGNLDRFKPKAEEPDVVTNDRDDDEDERASVKTVAERSGFQSREVPAAASPPTRKRRGRRSGRTRAFTTKTTPDYHALIYQIADGEIDGRERLVGEVIEQAIDALMREIAPERAGEGRQA